MIKIGFTKVEQKPQVDAIGITVECFKGTNQYANTVVHGRAIITTQENFDGDSAALHVSNSQEESDTKKGVFLQSVTEIKNLKIYASLAAPVGAAPVNTVAVPVAGKAYTFTKGGIRFVLTNDNEMLDKMQSIIANLSKQHPESGNLYDFLAVAEEFQSVPVVVRVFREFDTVEDAVRR